MRIYYYPTCSTCKKALKWLDTNKIGYEKRHIVDAKLTTKEIEDIYRKSGLPIQKLFNTSGRVYKELNLKDKLKDMTEKEKLELLASDGMLLKRPILELEEKVLVRPVLVNRAFVLIGFKEEEYKEKLL